MIEKNISVLTFVTCFLLSLLISGCSAAQMVSVTNRSPEHYQPSGSVVVLSRFPSNYREIANLSVVGAIGQDRAQLMAALTRKAERLGANALVVTKESHGKINPSTPAMLNPSGGNYEAGRNLYRITIDAEAILKTNDR